MSWIYADPTFDQEFSSDFSSCQSRGSSRNTFDISRNLPFLLRQVGDQAISDDFEPSAFIGIHRYSCR